MTHVILIFNMQDVGHVQRSKMHAIYREVAQMCAFLGRCNANVFCNDL
jgi:hypothetical protein